VEKANDVVWGLEASRDYPAGGQETAANLGAHVPSASVFHGYQRDVGIDVCLGICDIL
jgi:hypothetical protein